MVVVSHSHTPCNLALTRTNPFVFNTNDVRKKIDSVFGNRIIISEELLLGSIMSGGFNFMHSRSMATRIKDLYPDSTIIIFIRNQPDIIVSDYGQSLKDGNTESVTEYLYHSNYNQMANLRSFSFDFLKYDLILDYYKSLFPNRVHVYLYEDFLSSPENFIAKLAVDLGIELPINEIDFKSKNVRHNNLTAVRIGNKYRVLKYISPSRLTFGLLNHKNIFREKQTSKQVLGNHFEAIQNYYRASNQVLIQKHDLTAIKKYNYPV